MIRRPNSETNPRTTERVDEAFDSRTDRLAVESLGVVAKEKVGTDNIETKLNAEIMQWASEGVEQAGDSWLNYHLALDTRVPQNLEMLVETNPNLESTLKRLYSAKSKLESAGMPDDLLKLTLVPWQEMRHAELSNWTRNMLHKSGFMVYVDMPNNSDFLYNFKGGSSDDKYASLGEYIDSKIRNDGPWGIMLTQNREYTSYNEQDLISRFGARRSTSLPSTEISINGVVVSRMGVCEYIASSLQERQSVDSCVLAANYCQDGSLPVASSAINSGAAASFTVGNTYSRETRAKHRPNAAIHQRLAVE